MSQIASALDDSVSHPAPEFGITPLTILDALDRPDLRTIERMLDNVERLGRTESGYPIARPHDFSRITTQIGAFITKQLRLLDAKHEKTVSDVSAVINRLLATDIHAYGNEAMACRILQVRFLVIIGRASEALQIISEWSERPYRIEGGLDQVLEVFELDLHAKLILGRLDHVAHSAPSRLDWVLRKARKQDRMTYAMRFVPFLSILPSASGTGYPLAAILRVGARAILRSKRRRRFAPWLFVRNSALRGSGQILIWLAITMLRWFHEIPMPFQDERDSVVPEPPKLRWTGEGINEEPAILVSRAMGGLGDLTMMTPGLRALRQRYRRKVAFAIPRKFHAAFEGNPDIVLLDSDSSIDLRRFRNWVNLAICPAARYEARVAPKVRKGRVELFARGMGIKRRALDHAGWQPVSVLDNAQLAAIETIRALAVARGLPVIGVQMFSRETYRDYPHLFALIERLANEALVMPLHTAPVPLPEHPNIHPVFGKTLREAIAMVAASDVFVSVDSAFYHTAAAFDLPTIGLFGPTDGRTCSAHHQYASVIQPRLELACVPCWRNEDMACHITGTTESACMASISPDRVIAAVRSFAR